MQKKVRASFSHLERFSIHASTSALVASSAGVAMITGSITILAILCFFRSFLHTSGGDAILLQHRFVKETIWPVEDIAQR